MGDTTKIEWADHTASPWRGCEHATLPDGTVHQGCLNCYAEAGSRRNPTVLGVWGPDGTRVLSKSFVDNCRRWNAAAEKAGKRASVFPSWCDPFEARSGEAMHNHKKQIVLQSYLGDARDTFDGTLEEWQAHTDKQGWKLFDINDARRELFRVIDSCPWLDFLLLTKRPQNVRKMWPGGGYVVDQHIPGEVPPWQQKRRDNVWLITSVSDQHTADQLIPALAECRDLVPVLGLSMEPLLGRVDLCKYFGIWWNQTQQAWDTTDRRADIDWVIVGGESGGKARPNDINWVRSLIAQCRGADVPCFVKQLGERLTVRNDSSSEWPREGDEWIYDEREFTRFQGDPITLRMPAKGGNIDAWPEDLRVRQFPETAVAP